MNDQSVGKECPDRISTPEVAVSATIRSANKHKVKGTQNAKQVMAYNRQSRDGARNVPSRTNSTPTLRIGSVEALEEPLFRAWT
jgi:hypothetical protein